MVDFLMHGHIYYLFFLSLQLAAFHFNENLSRQQAVAQCGEKCYSIMFPKFKKGGYNYCSKS